MTGHSIVSTIVPFFDIVQNNGQRFYGFFCKSENQLQQRAGGSGYCDEFNNAQPYADAGRYWDVAWPRTNMFGPYNVNNGFSGAPNDTDVMCQRWEWDWPATGTRGRKWISGFVVDSNGNPVSGATVKLFNTATGAFVASGVTKADGSYRIGDPNNVQCFAVAYLAGSPDKEGTTVNTLTGS